MQLDGNQLVRVHPNTFDPLALSLMFLSLERCPLGSAVLDKIQFHHLGQLRSLNLTDTRLDRPPANIPRSLLHLGLGNNGIVELKAYAFSRAESLVGLQLRGNAINFIHKNAFFGLHKLKWLDLSANRLVRLDPGAFSGLIFLNSLNLDNQRSRGLRQVREERREGKERRREGRERKKRKEKEKEREGERREGRIEKKVTLSR